MHGGVSRVPTLWLQLAAMRLLHIQQRITRHDSEDEFDRLPLPMMLTQHHWVGCMGTLLSLLLRDPMFEHCGFVCKGNTTFDVSELFCRTR